MILIVDDDKSVRLSLSLLLRSAGHETAVAASPEEALESLRASRPDLVVMDMNFSVSFTSGQEGLELLQRFKVLAPEVPVILITAWGSIDLAVEGMRLGAFDFVTKPWQPHAMLQRVATALELNSGRHPVEGELIRDGIIGNSRGLEEVLQTVGRVAPTDAPVLILGENGTGKELIARAIHANSRRASAPFVTVNLGGISRSLFESEMFGHVKGAFTGAVTSRKGRFAMADGGTIFLDEIGELDPGSQVKLLRVLQEHTYEALGDSATRRTDVRVVCATNADLPRMVAEGTFREDLFYRINLITLHIPALRQRLDDIPLLADWFVRQYAERTGTRPRRLTDAARRWLQTCRFPGNIRELRNMVERAVIVCDTPEIGPETFAALASESVGQAEPSAPVGGARLGEMERAAVAEAISAAGGNLSLAASSLGLSRQALYRRMEKYGLK
ncbi:MAG: sigma-54 dependent transcriptional regulator [Paramuribaculum sp.]|nr:sigma-54 dependent transcriptional regulator [Paramuribaculum sp.]